MPENNKLPRLSIYHLMLWTLCTAAYLALHRVLADFRIQQPVPFADLRRTSEIVSATISGTIVAGAITLGQSRLRGRRPMLAHPGHWLLAIEALQILIYRPLSLTASFLFQTVSLQLLIGGVSFLFCLASTLAVWHSKPLSWKIPFVALALNWGFVTTTILTIALGMIPFWLYVQPIFYFTPFVMTVGVMIAMSYDWAIGVERDWLHWTGVATVLANAVLMIFWRAAL